MAKKKAHIPERVGETLKKIGETPDTAGWDCHGTYVLLHRALERVAAEFKVQFDEPKILHMTDDGKTLAILVTGRIGDHAEWSIGEVSPSNNKNSYPFAMAEKRAKDRVILKLVGLHGYVYSEEEADDFKEDKASPAWNEYMAVLRDNVDWAYQLKSHIANEEWDFMAGMWQDIEQEVKEALFRAPSNGGFFTTEERAACKSDEFYKARKKAYGRE